MIVEDPYGKVLELIVKWEGLPDNSLTAAQTKLFKVIRANGRWDDRCENILHLLVSTNGYAIYKMLKARNSNASNKL